MRTIIAYLLLTTSAFAQSVPAPTPMIQNNVSVSIIGNNQNVSINQYGLGNHSAIVSSTGNDVPISITQSGSTNKSISLTVNCISACASSPYLIDQH